MYFFLFFPDFSIVLLANFDVLTNVIPLRNRLLGNENIAFKMQKIAEYHSDVFTQEKWVILRDKICMSWRVWFEAIRFPILHKANHETITKMCLTDSLFTTNTVLNTKDFVIITLFQIWYHIKYRYIIMILQIFRKMN